VKFDGGRPCLFGLLHQWRVHGNLIVIGTNCFSNYFGIITSGFPPGKRSGARLHGKISVSTGFALK